MSIKASHIFTFAAGAFIGSAVTYKMLKTKFEQIAQEEIDSVKEVFSKREVSDDADLTQEDARLKRAVDAKSKPDIREYAAKLQKESYTNYSNIRKEQEVTPAMDEKPYVIPPEEFGEEDYDTVSLTYYADDVLTDDRDFLVDDIEGTVGADFADHFGEYEDDSVFIRNDRLKIDYEILQDVRNYSDLMGR